MKLINFILYLVQEINKLFSERMIQNENNSKDIILFQINNQDFLQLKLIDQKIN